MKTIVLDFYGGLRRKAASFRIAAPRIDRRYALAGVLSLPVLVYGPYVAPFMLALAFFAAVAGIYIVSITRAGYSLWRPAVGLAAMVPFVGLAGPVESLPNWMQIVAHLFPVTYVFEGVRTLVVFGAFDAAAFVASVLLSGVYLFFIYLWTSAKAEQKAHYDKMQMID